tara:strand:- start:361 stop:513 length:153 start_codon:yes stop_codon:yes gene_type:complete
MTLCLAYFNFCWDNVGGIYKNYFFLPKKSGQPFQPLFLYMSVNCIIIYLK